MTLSYESSTPLVPASRRFLSSLICWIVIAAFVSFTGWSNWNRSRVATITATKSTTLPNTQLTITSRASLGEMQALTNSPVKPAKADVDRLATQLHATIAGFAVSPLDKLKAVVMTRELLGTDAALRDLDDPSASFNQQPALLADALMLREIYTIAPKPPDHRAGDDLVKDLGWFGQLALTQGKPADDPSRLAIVTASTHSLYLLMGMGAGLLGAAGLGFFLLILLTVLFAIGKMQFKFADDLRDTAAAPAFLETFAIWCVLMTALSLGLSRWRTGRSLLSIELVIMACTMLVALWPLCRGIRWRQLCQALGWHRGSGVFTEMGFGALGYLAGLPIIALGFCATLILIKLAHANPSHPIQQEMNGAMSISKIISLLLAASVAAPILEETMFRGALYFHLRRRWHTPLSALLVAFIFAAIHPQGWTLIPALGAIAIVLALLREWRGSLLASVTAHGINNAIVLLLGIVVLR